jgi:hypothetical protein
MVMVDVAEPPSPKRNFTLIVVALKPAMIG